MHNSKLIIILRSLSASHLKQFRDFVASPFFNKNDKLIILYAYLYKYQPDFTHKKLQEAQVVKHIFGRQTPNKDALAKLSSKLLKLLEQFIAYQKIAAQPLIGKLELLNFYDQQNLTTPFNNTFNNIKKLQNQYPYQDSRYFYNQLLIEIQYSQHLSTKKDTGTDDVNFEAINSTLDQFYLRAKLEQLCLMINRQRTTQFDYTFLMKDKLMDTLAQSPYLQVPVINIWYQALQLLTQAQNKTHYLALKQQLQEHTLILAPNEIRILYTYLENTSASIFKDAMERYQELFSLYQPQLQQQVIYTNGYLLPPIFRNIVTVALRLQKLKWLDVFLIQHENKIIPEYQDREDMYRLCKAMLSFEQNNYEQTLDLLNTLACDNIFTKMDERRIRLKIYYELNYENLFEDLINSFRKFMVDNKNKIASAHVQANRDFINFAYQLYKTIPKQHKTINLLETNMKNTQILPEKSWLLEKIEQLK